jgi:hypothetical protein
MAKVSPQLWQSFRCCLSLAVAAWTFSPAPHGLLAADYTPVTVYPYAGHLGPDSFTPGMYPHFDPSCEPSFRGGDCRNCCLGLWQGYCAQRVNCHCGLGHRGFGCYGSGCLGHGQCAGCSTCHDARRCACEASHGGAPCAIRGNVVVPQGGDDMQGMQPPVNPLPEEAAPPDPPAPEPSADLGKRPRAQTARTSPLPAPISFSAHSSASNSVRVFTAASRSNAGTTRLLQQLKSN